MSDKYLDYVGPWADQATVLEYLHINAVELMGMLDRREILGIKFNDGSFYFPTRQFHDDQVLGDLPTVLRVFTAGNVSMPTVATWLAGPSCTEGKTAWDDLREGRLQDVLTEASRDIARWAH